MIRFLRKLRIRDQLLVIAVITIIVLFVIIIATTMKITGIISRNNTEYINNITSQTMENVSRNVEDISRLIINVAYNPTIQEYLSDNDDMTRYQLSQTVEKYLISMRDLRSGIHDIVIIGENGNNSGYIDGMNLIKDELIMVFDGKSSPICAGVYEMKNTVSSSSYLIFGASVYDLEDRDFSRSKVGTVAAFIEPGSIGVGLEALSKSNITTFYLLDRNFRIFATNADVKDTNLIMVVDQYSRRESGLYSVKLQNRSLDVEVIELENIGGKMISIVDRNELLSESSQIRMWALTVFLIAMVFLAIPFALIINNIVNPLDKIMKFMNEIKSGNLKFLKKRVNLEGYAEISVMADEFNRMLDEVDNLTHHLIQTNTKLYESELLKKQTELSFLRSQINPHFLYNTLESIKSICNLRGVYEARDMAKSLAHIFRYSIKGIETVKLSEELEVVKSYMQIQSTRFKDRFEAVYDFSEEALSAQVIKMILQPIVENAIYHGLEPKRGKGSVLMEAKVSEDNCLIIKVKDDGVGMDNSTLERIRTSLADENSAQNDTKTSSIGLMNVSSRIKLTYGNEYGIHIYSEPDAGTEVTIKIPYSRRNTDA